MRRGLFDVGFEDFGPHGGGLPHEVVFSGLSGLGGIVVGPTTIKRANAYSFAGNPEAIDWDIEGGDIILNDPENTFDKERSSILHNRLRDVGLRREMVPPSVYDLTMAQQIKTFKSRVGLPLTPPASKVDQDTWVYLNYFAGLVRAGKFNPLEPVAIATKSSAEQINATTKGADVVMSASSVVGSTAANIVGGVLSAFFGGSTVTEKGTADSVPVKPKVPETTGAQPSIVRPSTSNQLEQNAATKTAVHRDVTSLPGDAAHFQRVASRAAGAPAQDAYGSFAHISKMFGGAKGLMVAAVILAVVIVVFGNGKKR
jgi:hypothetical protein